MFPCNVCVKYKLNELFSFPAWKRGAWSALFMQHCIDVHLVEL